MRFVLWIALAAASQSAFAEVNSDPEALEIDRQARVRCLADQSCDKSVFCVRYSRQGRRPYFRRQGDHNRPLLYYHCDYLVTTEFKRGNEALIGHFEKASVVEQRTQLESALQNADNAFNRFEEAKRKHLAETDPLMVAVVNRPERVKRYQELKDLVDQLARHAVEPFLDFAGTSLHFHRYYLGHGDNREEHQRNLLLQPYLRGYLIRYDELDLLIERENSAHFKETGERILEKTRLAHTAGDHERLVDLLAAQTETRRKSKEGLHAAAQQAFDGGQAGGEARPGGTQGGDALLASDQPGAHALSDGAANAAATQGRIQQEADNVHVPELPAPAPEAGSGPDAGTMAAAGAAALAAGAAGRAIFRKREDQDADAPL